MKLTTPLLLPNNTLELPTFVLELKFKKNNKGHFLLIKSRKATMHNKRKMQAMNQYESILELDFHFHLHFQKY